MWKTRAQKERENAEIVARRRENVRQRALLNIAELEKKIAERRAEEADAVQK